MNEFILRHKLHWSNRYFSISTLWAGLLLVASIVINLFANNYATLRGANPVTDIILNNVRVYNVDWVVNYGPVFIVALLLVILLIRPSAIPFTVKSVALFIMIRAGFISLTHLGQFEPQLILPSSDFFDFFGGGNTGGLFFSGHTGIPFLSSLIFWDNKTLRYGFITLAIIMGTAMLLAHLHYTIDVVGAFFITPTIFYLAQKFFKRDYELLHRGISN